MSEFITESPFEFRHRCWFCGEPSASHFTFPAVKAASSHYAVLTCSHSPISVPSCHECKRIAHTAKVSSIWQVNTEVKNRLMTRYKKDLAIGIQWTQAELASSEFEHGNFAGFAKSAWFMFEVARDRLNFKPWPLVLNGVELVDEDEKFTFFFDGVDFPSINHAITHYAKAIFVEREFFSKALSTIATNKITTREFAQTVRLCRLLVGASDAERKEALRQFTTL